MPTDKILKFKRGNTTKNNAYTGSDGELTVDRTKKTLVVHDGINAGGSPLATEESVNNVIQELENKVDINENITTQGNLFNGLDQLVKLDSSGKLPAIDGSQLTGVSSGSLVDSGVNAGTYKSVTVNSKGIITAGTNPTTLLGYGITDADTSAQVTTKVNNAVSTAVSGLVNSAPGLLDTLDELANALGDDPNFATTVANNIATKVTKNADIVAGTGTKVTYDAKGLVTSSTSLSASDIPDLDTGKLTSGTLPVLRGGTGVTTSTGTGSVVLSASPTFTGNPIATTQAVGDNSTRIATTAYADRAALPINSLRADRYLALQNIANMVYTSGDLTKIQYNNATDVDYEVLGYTGGNLTTIQHYVGSVLKGTTTLSYTSDNLVSAVFA